jgi:hypothetical protein
MVGRFFLVALVLVGVSVISGARLAGGGLKAGDLLWKGIWTSTSHENKALTPLIHWDVASLKEKKRKKKERKKSRKEKQQYKLHQN